MTPKKKDTFLDYVKFAGAFLFFWLLGLLPKRFFDWLIKTIFKVCEFSKKIRWPLIVFICMIFYLMTNFVLSI